MKNRTMYEAAQLKSTPISGCAAVAGDVRERRLQGVNMSLSGKNAKGAPSTGTVQPLNMDTPGSRRLLPEVRSVDCKCRRGLNMPMA